MHDRPYYSLVYVLVLLLAALAVPRPLDVEADQSAHIDLSKGNTQRATGLTDHVAEPQSPICGPIWGHSGTITSSESWPAGFVHVFYSDVVVNPGVTLSIGSGAVVKIEYWSLGIKGKLLVSGSETSPVYFTSLRDDSVCGDTNGDGTATAPAANNWGRIEFLSGSDSNSVIRRAVIRYAGGESGFSPRWAAIRLNSVSPTLENISFEYNNRNAAEIVAGDLLTTGLNSTSVVYWLPSAVTVPAGNTLTIAPGAKIKANKYGSLIVKGKLSADGTQAAPITFTSEKDDTLCGVGAANEPICDTNNDRTATAPAAADWRVIEFKSGSDAASSISRAIVRYAGVKEYSSGDGPIRLEGVSPTLDNITFANNYRNAVEIISGAWLTTSWNSTSVVYWLPSAVTVPAGNTLTIAPGVKIKAGKEYGSILVKGKLSADGTQANPIIFTSERDDTVCGVGAANEPICDTNNDTTATVPAAGDWGGIEFQSGSDATSVIRCAVIRYSGDGSSIYPVGAIRLLGVSPTLEKITFTGNDRNAVEIVGTNWLTNRWISTDVVYWMQREVTIPAGNTLTIGPGVKIKVARSGPLSINGKLSAEGTQANPITFTSEKDDTVCGIGAQGEAICDTNNDGTGSVGAPNDWQGVAFSSSSDATSTMQHAIIRYAGKGSSSYTTLGAVRLIGASPRLAYVRFHNNQAGLSLSSGAQPRLTCNDFMANLAYGIQNNQPSSVVLAENQWWGAISGPRHSSNPSGTGDVVSNGVDFTPWSHFPCTYSPTIRKVYVPLVTYEGVLPVDPHTLLLLHFDGSYTGAQGQVGNANGTTFVPGRYAQGVLLDANDMLTYPTAGNLNREQGALEFWLRPTWAGNDGKSYALFEVGQDWFNRMLIVKDGANNLRFLVWDSSQEYGVGYNVAHWRADEWHHIGVTWAGTQLAIYVDGQQRESTNSARVPDTLAPTLAIGARSGRTEQVNAVIDEFRISDSPRIGN